MANHLLSSLILIPLIGSLLFLILPLKQERIIQWLNLGFSILLFILIAFIGIREYQNLQGLSNYGDVLLIEKWEWFRFSIGSFGEVSIDYFLGLDGINFPLIILSGVILVIGAIFSFEIKNQVKGYMALYQLISAAIIGSFLALDFFLFYLFFEFMLLPMFFLIGIWGGPRREYASIKFFIYTLFGSLFILAVMIVLNISTFDMGKTALESASFLEEGLIHGFNLFEYSDQNSILKNSPLDAESAYGFWSESIRFWAFWALIFGFMIKLPAVPLHTWLPDAHVEAPTPVSIILAALLLKIGAYGIIRIALPVFPDIFMNSLTALGIIGVISIVYGGMNALAMKDLKKMIAYSSVSHMGFVLLGLAAFNIEGLIGANYQLLSHGLISAMLFILAGVIYRRTGSRDISHYSGLNAKMPVYASFTLLAFLAGMGLPGFSGFIAEVLVLIGAFGASMQNGISIWLPILGLLGIFISAAYFLWTMQRMFFGKFSLINSSWGEKIKDLENYEKFSLMALVLFALLIGIFPSLIIDISEISIQNLINQIQLK
ncbi:NADH-quinone oxidoreductase subunit M [Hyphobacterium sp. CCMP332]|nr:NADH-quinone oxidoreductase subunit M [Hyphobacterium sp. CCMP332]